MRANKKEIIYIKENNNTRIIKNNIGVLWTEYKSYNKEKRCKLFKLCFRSYIKAIKGLFKLLYIAANLKI